MGKKKVVAVIDTEACPIVPMGKDEVDPRKSRVYDVGYIIGEKRGKKLIERSFVVADWFFNPLDFMKSAYYANKIPQYRDNYHDAGEWKICSMLEVFKQFRDDCKKYGASEAWAYNCRYDATVLNESVKDASGGFNKYFLPYGMKWRDMWRLASLITSTAGYNEWAQAHGFTTPSGCAQTGVEAVTRFLTGETDFAERHTALDDARHEWDILQHLRFRHYKTPEKWGAGNAAAMRYAKQHGYYVPPEQR